MRSYLKLLIATLGLSTFGTVVLAATHVLSPSDAAIRARFLAHRVDFQRLVVMASEDSHLTRIAPTFTWLDNDVAWPRKNVGISEQRWNEYRQIFQRVGTSDGTLKGVNPNRIIFPIASEGLVPTGFQKGLVYSKEPLAPVLKSLDESPPKRYWNGPDRSHVLAYKLIAPHWYIYFERW
jgi:hypothetical protein